MQTKLIEKIDVAEGTTSFHFEKPADFHYKAGQSIDLTLVNPPETDAEGNTRAYTLSSAPHEGFLAVTTRMRDTAFKRVLKDMAPGTELSFEGPFGDLTLHEKTERPAVFLAGGIGITPFFSMAKDAAVRKLPHRIALFYSNRRPEDASYLSDLSALAQENTNFTFVPTMTEMEKSAGPWNGETGYIDAAMLERHSIGARANAVFYLAGPSTMVAAMRTTLNNMGVSNDDIRTEEFTGY
jgi:ferredoxin-NADP reductase